MKNNTRTSKDNPAVKALAAVLTVVTVLVFCAAIFYGMAGVTMLLVGALHSAVPVVPAISFVGSGWLVALFLWFRFLAIITAPGK